MSILSRVRSSRDTELSPKWKTLVWNLAMTVMLVLAANAYMSYVKMNLTFDGAYLAKVFAIAAVVIGLAAVIGFELIRMPWGTGRIIVGLVFLAYLGTLGLAVKVIMDGGLANVLGLLQKVHVIQPGDNVTFVASAYFAASIIGFVGGVSGIWLNQFPARPPLRLPSFSRSGIPRVAKRRSKAAAGSPARVTPGVVPQQRTAPDDEPRRHQQTESSQPPRPFGVTRPAGMAARPLSEDAVPSFVG